MELNKILTTIIKFIWFIPRRFLMLLIVFYQKTFSLDHGVLKDLFPFGFCKFSPSCSQYAYKSIEKHGVIIGLIKSIWRIFRCNPWSKGGHDPAK